MALDPSIFNNIGRTGVPEYNPLAELAQFQQLQGQQQQNRLGELAFADRERALADAAAQRTAVQGFGADTTANYNRLLQTGNLGAAQGYQKGVLEQQKGAADISKTGAESFEKHFANYRAVLGSVSNPQQAAQFAAAMWNDPVSRPLLEKMGVTSLEESLARIPQDAQGFRQWQANAAIGIQKLAELAKVQNVNLGGTMQTQSVQPATGEVTQLASAPITQDANSIASNATAMAGQRRQSADAAAGRGMQLQIAGMVDSRARDLNANTKQIAADAKQQAANDKAVTKFSDTLQKEGVPEIEAALAGAENTLARYPAGDAPGVGRLSGVLPAWMLSEEGGNVRQSVAAIRNIILNARSGAAVTDQELRRLVEELGAGGQSEAHLRTGIERVRVRFEKVKANAAAGVSDEVKNTYEDRGGVKITRGGAAPSKAGALSPAEQSELEQLRKQLGRR